MKNFTMLLLISILSLYYKPYLANAQEDTKQSDKTIDKFSIPVKFQDMPEIKGNNIKQLEAVNSKSDGREIIDFRLVCNDASQEKVWYYNNVPDFNPNTNNLLKFVLRSANYSRVRMEVWLNTSNGWYTASFNNVSDIWSLYTLDMTGIPVNITDIAIQISESSDSIAVSEEYFHYLQLDYMEISNTSSVFWSNDFSSASGWNILATSSVSSGEYSFNARHVNDIFKYLVITGTSANSSWNNALDLAKSNTIANHIYLDEYFLPDNSHYLGFMYMVNDDNYFIKALNTNGKSYTDVINHINDFPATISISEGLDQYAQDVMPDHVESKVTSGEAVLFHEQNIYMDNQSSISIAANSSTKLNEIVDVIAPLNQTCVKEMPIALSDPDVQDEMASAGSDPEAMDDFNLALDIVTAQYEAKLAVATAYMKTPGAGLSAKNAKYLGTYTKIHTGPALVIPLALSVMTIKEGYDTNDQDKIDEGYGGVIDLGVGVGISLVAPVAIGAAASAGLLGTAAVGSAASIAAVGAVGAGLAYSVGNYVVEKETGKSLGTHAVSAASHVSSHASSYKASVVNNAEKSKTVINNTQTKITNSLNSASSKTKTVYNSVKTKVGESVSSATKKITSTASTVKKWFGWGDYFYWTWDETTQQIRGVSILPDYSKSVTGLDDNIDDNTSFSVSKNYPNPFSGSTTISFSLNESNNVSVKIYNLQGQLVKTLVEEQNFTQGSYSFEWEGNDDNNSTIPSGIYIYQVRTNQNLISNKLMKLN